MKEYIEREVVLQAMGEEPCVWNDTDEERQMRNDWRYYTDLVKEAPAADVVERETISGIMRESIVDVIKEFASNFDRKLCLRQTRYAEKGETEKAQAFEEVHELLMKAVEEV